MNARSTPEGSAETSPTGSRRGRADLSPLARLRPLVAAHPGDLVLSALFLIVSSGATVGLTFALRILADKGLSAHTFEAINRSFLLVGGVMVVLALATAGRFYFITRLGERVVADLRIQLHAHLITLDQTYFAEVHTGEVLSRMTTDLTLIESLVGGVVSVAVRNLITVTVALAVMIVVSPTLTGLVALLAVVVIAPLALVGRRVRSLSASAQAGFADAIAFAGETLDGLATVQAFGREAMVTRRFRAAIEAAFARSRARIAARALMTALVMILVFGGVALILWRASIATFVTGSMSGGVLLQFVFLSVLAAGGVGGLGEAWGEVQKCAGAMARINAMLDAQPIVAAPAHPRPLPSPPIGSVSLRGVRFAYPDRADAPALQDFDLEIGPGERIALVGPSGAGKSTVFKLLLRFYDPGAGVVSVDGVDVREADPAEVRARFALVAQDATLFSGSALDNLRFGDEAATAAQALDAARLARADGFIQALPGGLDASLGERGRSLSGGERQRLAIARAALKQAPILLLDEATSALDAENERLVQEALSAAMRGRTTLVIAHRLATVRRMDRIVVIDGGRIVESGTHDELVAREGLYARLARLQFDA